MFYNLSEGSLEKMMRGEQLGFEPVLQILAFKRMTNFSSLIQDTDRFRLKISDGRTYNAYIVLATPNNHLIHSKFLKEYSIVRINKYVITHIKSNGQTRALMVILKLDVLVPGCQVGKVIGGVDVSLIEEQLQLIDINE